MNNNQLRNALSGINKAFIAESDDFGSVAADFKKEKTRRVRLAALTLCIVSVGAGTIGLAQSGILKDDTSPHESEIVSISSDTDTASSSKAETSAVATSQPTESEAPDEPLYYSKLVGNTEAPELDGYSSEGSFSIAAFNEGMLKDAAAVIEGEVLDIWVNTYEYTTASDKFEQGGVLHHKLTTVAYKIKIDRVYSGGLSVGDEVTVEDCNFECSPVISIKKGSSYVIPVGKGDGRFYESDKITSGDTALKSCYFTLYQFHPQIERVSGGYVVSSDWKSLTADSKEIIIDTENAELPYSLSLRFVPDDIFDERISPLLES